MAEILLRVVDKVGADVYKNCQCLKRGDVVVVQPDGWPWGREELTNPDWRIIKLPNVTVAEMQQFLSAEPITDPAAQSRTRLRRWYYVDTALPTGQFRNYLNDATRASATFTSAFTFAQFDALRKQHTSVQDPAVIG